MNRRDIHFKDRTLNRGGGGLFGEMRLMKPLGTLDPLCV